MKNLTKFKKQLIAIGCLALVAVACLAVYAVRSGKDSDEEIKPTYAFNEAELEAIKAFKGKASFTFKGEKGKADDFVAAYMRIAEGYASVNKKIKVEYGKGSDDCALTVNGTKSVPDKKALFKLLEDGTPYATDARAFFNTALFGKDLGAVTDALSGYNLDGDRVNNAGYPYLYGPLDRKDLKYVYVENEFDKLTFVPVDGSFYLADTSMDMATATVSTLVAAARAPVASGKVENPTKLSDYGLDSVENATATLIVQDKNDKAYNIRIGKMLADGSGFYALCHGKDDVYILPGNIANYMLVPKEKFLVANYGIALSQPTEVYQKVNELAVNLGEDLVKAEFMSESEKANHPINYTWKITAPGRLVSEAYGYSLPNYGNIGDVFNALCALSSEDIVEADVTEEALKKYGLDTPYRSYSWLHEGKTRCTVYFSKPGEDGSYYVYGVKETVKSGEKKTIGISTVKAEAFPYIGYETLDYLDTQLYTQYFDKLDWIKFTRDGKEYSIDIKKKSDGTVESATLNGKAADLTSCRNFFRGVLHCKILEEYNSTEEQIPEIFNVKLCSGGKVTEISFGRISSMKAYCLVDGKAQYVMDYNLFETLVGGADKLIAGEKVEW